MTLNIDPAFHLIPNKANKYFDYKVDNLHSTDEGKSSEKPHCASNSRQLRFKVCFFILGDLVKSWGVEIDSYPLQFGLILLISWLVLLKIK